MSNSKLVSYTKISPNRTSPRNHKIDTITIHHMAGNLSVESCGAWFALESTAASSNYGIGSDGRIGLYVSEKFFKKNPELCRKFAEASRKGWEWVRNNRKEAVDIVMKYVKEANVSTNIYVQKWMLEEVLEMQEDVKGEAPSFNLNVNAFYWLNEVLLKHGYISKPIEYERLTGGKQ